MRKTRNLNIWAYNGSTLELITHVFSTTHKAAKFFNVDYRSILANMDTSKPTIKKGKLVLLFSYELSELHKKSLSDKMKLSTNENTFLWVYKKVDGIFTPINDNKPTFISKIKACEGISISKNTTRKYIDSDKSYKGLYYYRTEK